jgi:Rrf2 family protein
MITIPKKVEYSIIFIAYLSKNGGKTVSLTDTAMRLNLPYRFLGQLAMALKKAKIVESKEGKSGGYFLIKGWEKKTLYDLLESLGENKHMVKCLGKGEDCARRANCEIRNVWGKIEKSFVAELKNIKLAEI